MGEEQMPLPETQSQPVVTVGEFLPGLLLPEEMPKGSRYPEQIVSNNLGDFRYAPFQQRDGKIRWVSQGGGLIVVDSGTGTVLDFKPPSEQLES